MNRAQKLTIAVLPITLLGGVLLGYWLATVDRHGGARLEDRFGAHESGQRLVAVAGQKEPLQIRAQAAPLGERSEESIKLGGISFPRAGGQGERANAYSSSDLHRSLTQIQPAVNKLLLGTAARPALNRQATRTNPHEWGSDSPLQRGSYV